MNKKNIVTGLVFIAVLSVVVAIVTTDATNTDEVTQTAGTKKSSEQVSTAPTEDMQAATAENKQEASSQKTGTQKASTQKTSTKTASRKTKTAKRKTKQSASSQTTKTRVTRVRWPGMKYRMVRVVEEDKIEPATELRTWSRKQWVDKVTSLRKADNDVAAEQYITAYNEQYPGKDLNRYLK